MDLEESLTTKIRISTNSDSSTNAFQHVQVSNAGGNPNNHRQYGLLVLNSILNQSTTMTKAKILILMKQWNIIPNGI
jgi:hypothetical protein